MAYKILIVDDVEMMTELLSDQLRDCGYDTLVANSSRQAISLLQLQPDLIILDINMPEMDGLELCKSIRNHITKNTCLCNGNRLGFYRSNCSDFPLQDGFRFIQLIRGRLICKSNIGTGVRRLLRFFEALAIAVFITSCYRTALFILYIGQIKMKQLMQAWLLHFYLTQEDLQA